MVKVKFTPSEKRPLVKYANGKPPSGMLIYSSVVGIILYLSGHTSPDIAFAFNFCVRYMFIPKRYHGFALNRLRDT